MVARATKGPRCLENDAVRMTGYRHDLSRIRAQTTPWQGNRIGRKCAAINGGVRTIRRGIASDDRIIARPSFKTVRTPVVSQQIITVASHQNIISKTAKKAVVAPIPKKPIVCLRRADQQIVACVSMDLSHTQIDRDAIICIHAVTTLCVDKDEIITGQKECLQCLCGSSGQNFRFKIGYINTQTTHRKKERGGRPVSKKCVVRE